jgi:hypothetical protein
MKKHLWEATVTSAENGEVYTEYLLSENENVDGNTVFDIGRKDNPNDNEWLFGCDGDCVVCAMTVEETTEFRTVHYNHRRGNKVVINMVNVYDNQYRPEVVYATDDFEPYSEGATYVFRAPFGNQTYVMGQTYHDEKYDTDKKFEGYFSTYTEDEKTVMRPQGACTVIKNETEGVTTYCKMV